MTGTTMVATLERLGVLATFVWSRMSSDNPFSESLFRTPKNRPDNLSTAPADLVAPRAWVGAVGRWYDTQHLHGAIRFVTLDRFSGRDVAILAADCVDYQQARAARPDRWSAATRKWEPLAGVRLHPGHSVERRTHRVAA